MSRFVIFVYVLLIVFSGTLFAGETVSQNESSEQQSEKNAAEIEKKSNEKSVDGDEKNLPVTSSNHAADKVGPISNCKYTFDVTELLPGETDRPNVIVRTSITKLFCAIEAEGKDVPIERVKVLVEEIVIPSVGTEIMSRWVLGKNWRKLKKSQKREFISLFKGLLVRTYAGSLSKYVGFKVTYLPYKHEVKAKKANVKLAIERADGPEIPLAFKLRKDRDGKWKVYDALVDGISLVANYRTTFGSIIKKKGVNVLLDKLRNDANKTD